MKAVIVIDVDNDLDLSDIHANVELYPTHGTVNGEPFYVKYYGLELRPLPKRKEVFGVALTERICLTDRLILEVKGWNKYVDKLLGEKE